MDFRVFLLAVSAITVGLVELVVGGILPVVADDLNVSIATAGQLITVFALVYAIAGPVLLSLTAKVERKKLYLIALGVFFIGNVLTYFSPSFGLMMAARVLTAASAALVIVLSLTITARLVEPKYRAKALGYIYMGISSSLVLGVPIGIVVTNAFGWRSVFLGIAILTIGSILLIAKFLETIPTGEVQPLSAQIRALANKKIFFAHLATMFMLAGHYTVYAYFTPFLETTMQLSPYWISVFYFLFGLAAVGGGAFGGGLASRLGSKKSILVILGAFAISLFALPYSTFSIPLFIVFMMVWGALSWALAPAQQDYIITSDPVSSDIHQSFNNSALQVGIALGSGVGGMVFSQTGSVTSMPAVGGSIVIIAFICAVISLSMSAERNRNHQERTAS
ncbi:MFS family major facilitator transporter [Sporosarcina newyorkensis 2681]|uniref:MFS family major facilitator transporter n=1 Tax=Sporosarcina newyorkensis 2681 TaxID=1027292 RepID=F9DWC9_9BACL|nr:MFS transporter [Sporosarcina newyorkensis]EGQ21750.1 MFS family major facilitator transporter [Sporosarcina newyorkensis 2681]